MRRFGLAALQLELGPGNNLDVIAAEIASAKRRFPWIDMVMLAELASHGVSVDNAAHMDALRREQTFIKAQIQALAEPNCNIFNGPEIMIT